MQQSDAEEVPQFKEEKQACVYRIHKYIHHPKYSLTIFQKQAITIPINVLFQEAPNDVNTKEVTDDSPADSSSTDILKNTDGNETSLINEDVPTNIEVPKVSIKEPMEEKTPPGSSKI